MMKPVHDITRHCHHWPESDPTPPTNQEVSTRPSQASYLIFKGITWKQSWATSKAEYSNTQQGLPDYDIFNPLTRHARLLAWWVCFVEKQQRVSPYFHILAFSSSSINRSTLASIQKHTWWKQLFFIIQSYFSSSLFHFLLYVAKGLSSLDIRERRTIRIEFVNLARQT